MDLPANVRSFLEQLEDGLPGGVLHHTPDYGSAGSINIGVAPEHAITIGQKVHETETTWSIQTEGRQMLMLSDGGSTLALHVSARMTEGYQALADTLIAWDQRLEGGITSQTPLIGRPWTEMPRGVQDQPDQFTHTLYVDEVLSLTAYQVQNHGPFGTQYTTLDPVAQTLAVLIADTGQANERYAYHRLNHATRLLLEAIDSGVNPLDTARALTRTDSRTITVKPHDTSRGITP